MISVISWGDNKETGRIEWEWIDMDEMRVEPWKRTMNNIRNQLGSALRCAGTRFWH